MHCTVPVGLTTLHLGGNKMTDGGFATLMPLLKKDGKLSNLTVFSIGSAITDKGMKEFADILAMGSLPQLLFLELQCNQIGDAGMQAFASAVASGSLPALKELGLHSNQIGDAGMTALAGAIASGSLPALKEVIVDAKQRHPQLVAACKSRNIRIE